jgi:PhoPQ-activated pathogenicity-related protein
MRAWSASSESRDFREARWSSHRCRRSGDNHACSVARARNGYTAVYAEAWFSDRGYPDFPLATVVCIVGAPGTEAPRC